MNFAEKYTDHTYLALRVMAALMFMAHGLMKFFDFPIEYPRELDGLSIGAAGIELVGGVLVALGLFTRPAAFICSGMSAVGYWLIHGTKSFYPIANDGELIALYCFVFLFIAAYGPGKFSVDEKRNRA